MKFRREFTGPVSAADATARLRKLLKSYKFLESGSTESRLHFFRGRPGSSLYGVKPRGARVELDAFIEDHGPESVRVVLELRPEKMFQPPHRMAALFYEGELDDMRLAILENAPTEINRKKQNRAAGLLHIIYLVACAAICWSIAHMLAFSWPWLQVLLTLAFWMGAVYLAEKFPLQLIDFRTRLPRGAKLVSNEEAPVAPKVSSSSKK